VQCAAGKPGGWLRDVGDAARLAGIGSYGTDAGNFGPSTGIPQFVFDKYRLTDCRSEHAHEIP